MKKKIIIIISIIVIGITITMLYTTFATSTTTSNDDVYDITLTGTNTVNIPKKSSKTVYYQICNTNKGKVKYGVGYRVDNNDVKVKVYWDSIDPETGIIDYGENKFIKLKISNNSTSDGNVTLSTVLGYEYGGDLIPSSGVTLVTEKINETNYLMQGTNGNNTTTFLRSTLTKEQIGSITFTNDNIAAEGMTSVDVSKDSDGTVLLWYGNANSDTGLYDIYIGSDNGLTSFYSGQYLFSSLTNVTSIDLKYIDTSKVTNMAGMFYGCSSLTNLNISSFNTSNVTNMNAMFYNCQSLLSLDVSNFDTSKVTDMTNLFFNCKILEILDVSKFNTSFVTGMDGMFYGCSSLKKIDVSNFDTSNVTSMYTMFLNMSLITELDVSNFNTEKVTNMGHMFDGLKNVSELDVSNFDTSNVTQMHSMFQNMSSLTSLDLSNFDTSKVTRVENMFSNLSDLKNLDLRNADFSKVTSYGNMFYGMPIDSTIYVKDSTQKDWIESKFTTLTGVTIAS